MLWVLSSHFMLNFPSGSEQWACCGATTSGVIAPRDKSALTPRLLSFPYLWLPEGLMKRIKVFLVGLAKGRHLEDLKGLVDLKGLLLLANHKLRLLSEEAALPPTL